VFIKDINTPERERIYQSLRLLSIDELVQGLKVFILKINNLEIRFDTRRCDTLGDNSVISLDAPADQNLSRIGVVLFSELDLKQNFQSLASNKRFTSKLTITSSFNNGESVLPRGE
jgi:hypothetical protein